MPSTLDKLLNQYDYNFPEHLIAQEPASPRDSARLLVYNQKTNKIIYDTFSNITKYIPKNSVLVFNQTKVVPARLQVKKESGGKAEILYIEHNKDYIKALSNRPLKEGSNIGLNDGRDLNRYGFKVIKRENQFYFLKPNFPITNIKSILQKFGKTPLPPYIKHSKLTEKQKQKEYQTVFAKSGLSVAAPTASLHFTKKLISQIKKQGIDIKFVTLNVNLGTFASLKEENISSGLLHSEYFEIDKQTASSLNSAKAKGKKIIAVGTTVIRTLESATINKKLQNFNGDTRLFIQPGYKFKFTDGIITNFHVPKSSLMMLIAAKTGRKNLLNIYKKAILKKFRLFSFGDGMLILP
jgi:S-adenosylmethionine:tRNA ribosyltransferase-isomerase